MMGSQSQVEYELISAITKSLFIISQLVRRLMIKMFCVCLLWSFTAQSAPKGFGV